MTEQPDSPVPGKPEPPAPPKLEFKADPRQAARLAWVRGLILGGIVLLLAVAVIWVLSFRPPVPPVTDQALDTLRARAVETLRFSTETLPVPAGAVQADPVESAIAGIDSAVRRAEYRWVRAEEYVPQAGLDSSGAVQAATLLHRAAVLAESARADVDAAGQLAEVILRASRTSPRGSGHRLSVTYAAAREYLRYVGQDADDHLRYYQSLAEAVGFLAQGDAAGFDIKQNVANSYRRSWEQRQRATKQRAAGLDEAVRGLRQRGP